MWGSVHNTPEKCLLNKNAAFRNTLQTGGRRFLKTMRHGNYAISLTGFSSDSNPKWPVIVVWTVNIWCVFRVKPPFSNSLGVLWTGQIFVRSAGLLALPAHFRALAFHGRKKALNIRWEDCGKFTRLYLIMMLLTFLQTSTKTEFCLDIGITTILSMDLFISFIKKGKATVQLM